MKNRVNNQQGFTLLEVIVALAIFSIGMLGIAGVQINAMRFNLDSNTRGVIGGVSQTVLEEILLLDAENTIFRSDQAVAVWDLDTTTVSNDLVVLGGGTYSATWEILTDNPIADMARVNVVVTGSLGRVETLSGYKRFVP